MCFYFQLLITLTVAALLTNASPLETDNTEEASLEIDLNTVAASVNTTDTDTKAYGSTMETTQFKLDDSVDESGTRKVVMQFGSTALRHMEMEMEIILGDIG